MNFILCIRFNQDASCLTLGTTQGFQVFDTIQFKPKFQRNWGCGIGIAELLNRTNFLALCGGGSKPQFPPNQIIIWDDNRSAIMAQLEFKSPVRNLRLRSELLVAVIDKEICVYQFNSLTLLTMIYTLPNPQGLCHINPHMTPITLVCPGVEPGDLYIGEIPGNSGFLGPPGLPKIVRAHHSPIQCLGISPNGRWIASASQKGTIIRVFQGGLMGEEFSNSSLSAFVFRRGRRHALITSLAFSPDNNWLTTISSSGTIHLFKIDEEPKPLRTPQRATFKINTTCYLPAILSFPMGALLPIATFPPPLLLVSNDGYWTRYSWNESSPNDNGPKLEKGHLVENLPSQ